MKKMDIVIVAFITATAGTAFHASVRAEQPAAQQAPAISSTGPAQSVWDGIYTEEQAKRGRALYSETCAACHAADLSGGEMAPALAGTDFKSNWNGLSVDDLFERIKVTMPGDNAGSLSRQQTADILAFVFSISRFPAGTSELVREAEILKSIKFEAFKPDSK